MTLPTFADVQAAASRLAAHVLRTPLLNSPVLDARAGARLLIKAECLQLTGSFKVRGAYNRLLQLSNAERVTGVVAWSAGNHGQALAFVGQKLGIAVTIVMPSDAPRAKIEGTARWGAKVVLYDRLNESRERIGREISDRTGAIIVPPFDDPHVIAGQGTVGLEALDDARTLGHAPELLLCPTGGGGLIAGCALAAGGVGSNVSLHSVEPLGYDDTARSLVHGSLVSNEPMAPSICDALMTTTPGDIPFAINRDRLSAGLVVTDRDVREAMRAAIQELRIVLEPGGAAALAAALSSADLVSGKTVIVVASGGNLDISTLSEIAAQQ